MVIVSIKISVDENYTTPVNTQIIIDVNIQVEQNQGGSFGLWMQRDRVNGLVNMGLIQYLYLPVQNIPPQYVCGSICSAQILILWLGCFSIFFFSPVFSAHSGLFRGGEKISQ